MCSDICAYIFGIEPLLYYMLLKCLVLCAELWHVSQTRTWTVDRWICHLLALARPLRPRGVASIHHPPRHPLAGSRLGTDSIPGKTLGTAWTSRQLMANRHKQTQTLRFTPKVSLESQRKTPTDAGSETWMTPNRKSRWPLLDLKARSCFREKCWGPCGIHKVFLTLTWQMHSPKKKKDSQDFDCVLSAKSMCTLLTKAHICNFFIYISEIFLKAVSGIYIRNMVDCNVCCVGK